MTIWEIRYMTGEVKNSFVYFTKIIAVRKYLNLLEEQNISELKILRNNKDYTRTLNKFLK